MSKRFVFMGSVPVNVNIEVYADDYDEAVETANNSVLFVEPAVFDPNNASLKVLLDSEYEDEVNLVHVSWPEPYMLDWGEYLVEDADDLVRCESCKYFNGVKCESKPQLVCTNNFCWFGEKK